METCFPLRVLETDLPYLTMQEIQEPGRPSAASMPKRCESSAEVPRNVRPYDGD